ncbi:helix-turn-helix transcriptional regulator [Hymenobacter norwichensis]|uniref:helix-turn-helix transcriptional regulator n=1 Tax=Hymenobacter norwichensis TaxID=223903 RepID=UPI0003B6F49E|nr:helix-turn-helix domain-containing protein [Hymenobacter norwichensis]
MILQHLQALQQGRPAAGSDMPRLLSIEQVIEELEVSRSTVQRWLKKGKPGRHGTTIVLQAYWFTTAKPRIPIAEIGLNLVSEISSNPKNTAAFPAPFNGIYLLATNALSVVRAGVATAKVTGFREGGSTGTSAGKGSLDLNRMQVAPDGKLLDQDGFAVAGVVHENEYVIPEWMRADPKVVQVEFWLEEKRLRGYAQGGATSEGGSQASPVKDVAVFQGNVATPLEQPIAVQQQQNERIDTWAREFWVVNQLHDFDQDYGTYKKVNNQSGISG